jgi:hypothetical protein
MSVSISGWYQKTETLSHLAWRLTDKTYQGKELLGNFHYQVDIVPVGSRSNSRQHLLLPNHRLHPVEFFYRTCLATFVDIRLLIRMLDVEVLSRKDAQQCRVRELMLMAQTLCWKGLD